MYVERDGECFEVFYAKAGELSELGCPEVGWYFWPCRPGCLPDGEPTGPYRKEGGALRALEELLSNPIGCWKDGCYLAVMDHETGECEVHGLPPKGERA